MKHARTHARTHACTHARTKVLVCNRTFEQVRTSTIDASTSSTGNVRTNDRSCCTTITKGVVIKSKAAFTASPKPPRFSSATTLQFANCPWPDDNVDVKQNSSARHFSSQGRHAGCRLEGRLGGLLQPPPPTFLVWWVLSLLEPVVKCRWEQCLQLTV